MNAYWIDAGLHDVYQETIADCPRYEAEQLCGLVFAETRGQAWAAFMEHERGNLDWTERHICWLVARDVARERGVAGYDDPLWSAVRGRKKES